MAQVLMDALEKPDCTLDDIKSVLDSHIDWKQELNAYRMAQTPLSVAIKNRKSVEIVEEILKRGAIVNLSNVKGVPFISARNFFHIDFTIPLDLLSLLLEHGAHVNGVGTKSLFFDYLNTVMHVESEVLMPMVKLMLPYTDISTRNFTMYELSKKLIVSAFNDQSDCLDNILLVVKFLLESGARPDLYKVKDLFKFTIYRQLTRNLSKYFSFINNLFKLISSYVFIKDFRRDRELETYNMASDFHLYFKQLESLTDPKLIHPSRILCQSLKTVWDNCLQQCQELKTDMIMQKCNLLQLLKDLCEDSSNVTNVSWVVAYQMLGRISHDIYPCYSHVLKHAMKKTDLMELCSLLLKRQYTTFRAVNLDCFYYLAKYLSKEDIINYLAAIIR